MNRFETRKKLEKTVKNAKTEMYQAWEKLANNENPDLIKELENDYLILSKRYYKLLDVLMNLKQESRKQWLNNKVNKNRLRARMKSILKGKLNNE